MIGTIEVFVILGLLVLLGVGTWALFFFRKQTNALREFKYARGANGEDGEDIPLKCGKGKAICIYRATQTCTAVTPNGFEGSSLDPISNGLDGDVSYGDFNPKTTVDLTKKMGKECNGNTECLYKFRKDWSSKPVDCNGVTQLIATYVCISDEDYKDGKCESWSPKPGSVDPIVSPPKGCVGCSTNLFSCPTGVLPASFPLKSHPPKKGTIIPKGAAAVISSFRIPDVDNVDASYIIDGVKFWWRQGAGKGKNGCPA